MHIPWEQYDQEGTASIEERPTFVDGKYVPLHSDAWAAEMEGEIDGTPVAATINVAKKTRTRTHHNVARADLHLIGLGRVSVNQHCVFDNCCCVRGASRFALQQLKEFGWKPVE